MARIRQTLPKRTNAFDGKKAHNDFDYVFVGRVGYESWMSDKLGVGDIIISERQLVHIQTSKKAALDELVTDALEWVKDIIAKCGEIRTDDRGGVFFVKVGDRLLENDLDYCAIAELEEAWFGEKRVYIIKSARPMHWERLIEYELLCVNPRP